MKLFLFCTAFTPDWSEDISWVNPWEKISWTSLTMATSFISYIEKILLTLK